MKKDTTLVQQESEKLRGEIVENGYSQDVANAIADKLIQCGSYLFNKSHSYAYAVLCFETAYLKAHYSVHFFKALFNLNKDKAGAINKYFIDAKYFGVNVNPPSINRSGINFTVDGDAVLFGLSAISGIGEDLAARIIDERETNGKYTSFKNLLERVPLNKKQIVMLIKAGAIPSKDKKLTLQRYFLTQYEGLKFKPLSKLPTYKSLMSDYGIDPEQFRKSEKQFDYDKDFILAIVNEQREEKFNKEQESRLKKYTDECEEKYLQDEEFWEFEALQIFIENNPFEQAYSYMNKQFEDVEIGDDCTIVGVISKVQKKKDKNGKQFAYANIYSSFGLVEGIIWHSTLKEYEDLVVKGKQVAIFCRKDGDEKVVVDRIKPYQQWLEQKLKKK